MRLNNLREGIALKIFAARVVVLDGSLELDITVGVDFGRRRLLLEIVLLVGSIPRRVADIIG